LIRRSPCELYIKFLLSHPHGFSLEEVRNKVVEMGLDFPNDDYVDRLASRIEPPINFRPKDKSHIPSQRFLLKHRLGGFYLPDKDSQRAHELVKEPRAKELIETLTLTEEPLVVVNSLLKEKGFRSTIAALQCYCSYYWDLALVDSVELNALLRMRPEYLLHNDNGREATAQDRLQVKALGLASYKDPRRMVTEMPITPMAGLLNRMRLGYMPAQVDLARLADVTRKAATVRAFDATMSTHPHAAAQARDFAMVAKSMTELIGEIGSPDQELQRELQQLTIKTNDTRPPLVQQLSEGRHTLDLQPAVVEAKEEDNGD